MVSHDGKTKALTNYFKSIIGVPGNSTPMGLQTLYSDGVVPSDTLNAEFSEAETKLALLSMNRNSAPGPDGFRPAFYRVAWTTVKSHILKFLEAFHRGEVELERINRSYMVLIPKKPAAVDVDAFRPICLQNCTLKILSKVLTTRLQKEIPKLIDLNQTGFIMGRSISDTFVYAMELVQVCHKRKKPTIVLKLDFVKAFDTVNWEGLRSVLQARGFSHKWIGWMFSILESSRSAVLVNGSPGPWINCRRGLRQGDPISPYLFLIVAETLQRLIRGCSGIHHPTDDHLPCAVLQYADDTLIVLRDEVSDVVQLKEILDCFAALSGLHINYSKSTLVPIHMPDEVVKQCVQIVGCKRDSFPQPYLGLPLSVHKLPVSAFVPYIHKTDRFLSCWQANLLNTMGRAVLVNSVLDSQLVYLMSSLQLPPSVVTQMDKIRRAFLWSGDKTGHASPATCLVTWNKVCDPKDLGGFGIRDLGVQNICLLLKLIHRLHCPQSSAWAQWIHSHASVVTLKGDIHGNHWEVLRSILPLYQAITSVHLGDGRCTSFWSDVWYGDEALADQFPALYSHCTNKEASANEVMSSGLEGSFVPRLSQQASQDLLVISTIVDVTQLSDTPDVRKSIFTKGLHGLDSGAIYRMLKARGSQMMTEPILLGKTQHRQEFRCSCGSYPGDAFRAGLCCKRSIL